MTSTNLFRALLAALLLAGLAAAVFASSGPVKEPAVAGAFYPADRTELAGMVQGFLDRAKTLPVEGRLLALVAPHAGYQYSGQVAAYAYRHLHERTVDRVILIGPAHYAALQGAAVITTGSLRTPLGTVPVDRELAKELVDEQAGVRADRSAFEREHSLEVQLPFLQTVLPKASVVPILIGQPTRSSFESLASRLAAALAKHPNALLIASTDLSHYHDNATARTLDSLVIDDILRLSVEDLERHLRSGEGELCGGYPVLVTMEAVRRLGATNGVLYHAANSGDVTSDKTRVVGYASMGLYRTGLTPSQRAELLSLARRTIVSQVREEKLPDYTPADARLRANGATFVTINRKGELRGCIGNMVAYQPLYRSVMQNAVAACTRDPRFPPLTRAELEGMEIEVTVLSPFEPLRDVKDIRIGIHGLYLVQGSRSGVLLPQVASEYHWDVPTFLEQLSQKAGLPKDAWKSSQLYSFTADIIK